MTGERIWTPHRCFYWALSSPNAASVHLYNAGCCYAFLGKTDLAFHLLTAAVKKGWRDRSQTLKDPNLESLHGDMRWNDVLGLISTGGGLESNRDAMINDLNNLAALAYQYRIRPSSMNGGNGAYNGQKLTDQLASTEDGTFRITVLCDVAVQNPAQLKFYNGTITATLDGKGWLGSWKYTGEFR